MKQTIQICTAPDGARIAYASVGAGPTLVKTANWLNHLEYDWESPIWRPLYLELARGFRLVRYDERGNGLSDWDVEDLSFEAFVTDLETVVDAAGLERFSLFGMSQGCAVSIAYAVRHPERVEKLVLYGGFAMGSAHGKPAIVARNDAMTTLTELGWGRSNPAYRQLFTSLFIPDASGEQRSWLDDLQRVTTSPANAARLLRAFASIDVRHLLDKVRAPTLVLHAREDGTVSFNNGRLIAAGIPGARFVPLESRNHILLDHEPAWRRLLDEVRAFLGEGGSMAAKTAGGELSQWLVTGGALGGALGRMLVDELPKEEESFCLPVPLPPTLAPGKLLAGRYLLDGVVAAGGMGTVFRARDRRLGRAVAVKVVTAPQTAVWRERVLREARAVAALNHPNIVALHDLGEDEGLVYLVMELVDGPNLADDPPRSPAEAVAVAGQICAALTHAHGRGIVHRDLKPGNVLLARTEGGPLIKVVDFGIALAAGDERLTGTGRLLGTPSYLAPEQVQGREVDGRTDLYALGVMLYEWVVGEPPFRGADPVAVVAQHVHAEPVPPRERCPQLLPGLDRLILDLLAKDPDRRPASAAAVARALEDAASMTRADSAASG